MRALRRLVTIVGLTPPNADPAPETTGRLLARVRDHLNAWGIDSARELLEQCRREHRLDALNLKFLEIEILVAARDWRGIAHLPGFDDLLLTRRPPAVTAALLQALYFDAFPDDEPKLNAYVGDLRSRARSLIRIPPPPELEAGAWRLYALEALSQSPLNAELASAARASGADLGPLEKLLPNSEAAPEVASAAVESLEPMLAAGAALVEADVSGAFQPFEQARALLAQLSAEERAALFDAELPRRAAEVLEATWGDDPPADWGAWLERLPDANFAAANTIARQGALEWSPDLGDASTIAQIATQLLDLPDTPPATDRLLEGLPHFVAWLRRDPAFPRAAAFKLYEAALDRLLLSGRTAAPMLDSIGVLAGAMLELGPSAAAYTRLLSDLVEFSGQGAGRRSAYWLIDLVEQTVTSPAPDQAAREHFWMAVLARLTPIAAQLSDLQRRSLALLGTALGWEDTLPDVLAPSDQPDATLAARLHGKLIAIYTLTESAGLQARDTLRGLAPDADIRINGDHGGTRTLRALAENADLFVVVAGSATHAATDFIRTHRGDGPLVYAAGRGAVSLLRAVEGWADRLEAA
jgi:hypothetical protein